jgi:hypothetical protein
VRKYDTFGTKVAYTLRGGLYTIPITGVYTPDYIPESGGPILGETVETLEGWLLKDEPDWSGAQTGMVADLLQLGDNLGYYNVPDWCNGVGTLTLSSATATWTRAQEIIEKYHWRIPRRVNQEDQYCYDFWMGSGSGVDDLDELSVYSSEEYTDILEDIVLFGGYQRKIDAGLEWKNQTNTYAGGKWVPSATWAAAYPTYLAEYDSYVDDAILAADTYLLQNEIAYLRTYTPAGLVGDEITLYEQYYDQLSTDYTDLRADKTDMISLNAKLLSLFEHNVIVYQSDYSIYSNGIDGQHEWELGTVAEGWRGTYIHTSFWDGNWGGQANRQLRYGKVYGGTITTYFSTSLVPRGFFEDDMMGYGARYFFGTGGLLNPWGAAVYKYDW